MLTKNIYKWHRTLSIIIAVPVLLWAISGFLHPVMTNIRPSVAMQALPQGPVDGSHLRVSLQEALRQNKIITVSQVRLIHIDTNWFYQVKTPAQAQLLYIGTLNGKVLRKGDALYAQYLAKLFLEGSKKPPAEASAPAADGGHDCCDAAAGAVLYDTTGAQVSDISLVTAFNEEYKGINRLLPVYKVSFERADGIRIYVETGQSRFALAVDNKRAAFTTFFSLVHTWGWLKWLGKGRLLVEILLTVLAFITTQMGLYIFFVTKSKKVKGNSMVKARRLHRYTAVVASLFTLMFTFSGAWHALSKWQEGEEDDAVVQTLEQPVAVTAIHGNIAQWQRAADVPVANIGMVQMNGLVYWQLYLTAQGQSNKKKDLMKDMGVAATPVLYVSDADGTMLEDGDEIYARYLAAQFSHRKAPVASVSMVTRFTDEYNFADKRLPVWKVQYTGAGNERVFVETSTGVLAKKVKDSDLWEGYSFALLHKHHFMDVAGKAWRDGSTMLGAALQVLMAVIGLILYAKWRAKRP